MDRLTVGYCLRNEKTKVVETKIRVGISDLSEKKQITAIELFDCHPTLHPNLPQEWHNYICLLKINEYLEFCLSEKNIEIIKMITFNQ